MLSTFSKSSWEQDSEDTYRTWCRLNGQAPVIERASFRKAGPSAREAAEKLLDQSLKIDAVLVLEELHGKAFLEAALDRGFTPPKDLLIAVAADGIEAIVAAPSLTAINLDPNQQSSSAVELLIRALEGDDCVPSLIVPARIIVRESTMPHAAARPERSGTASKRQRTP